MIYSVHKDRIFQQRQFLMWVCFLSGMGSPVISFDIQHYPRWGRISQDPQAGRRPSSTAQRAATGGRNTAVQAEDRCESETPAKRQAAYKLPPQHYCLVLFSPLNFIRHWPDNLCVYCPKRGWFRKPMLDLMSGYLQGSWNSLNTYVMSAVFKVLYPSQKWFNMKHTHTHMNTHAHIYTHINTHKHT